MKNKKMLWCSLALVFMSCGTTEPSSQPEGLFSQLSRAITKMGTSFKADGTLGYLYYDGSSTTETNYLVDIEVSQDAYYYSEQNLKYNNPTMVENYFKTDEGKFGRRTLNYMSNQVLESYYDQSYDEVMSNPFPNLEVKKLGIIRSKPNWFEVNDYNISKPFITFLTGYDVTSDDGLNVSQFAVHFDGDVFDQFRILLEYEEADDDYSMIEQYLFELDLSGYDETTPKKLEAFEETAEHEKLREAFFPFKSAKNVTMNFAVTYEDASVPNENYDFILDFKNNMMLSLETRTGMKTVQVKNEETGEMEDEYEQYDYILGLKNGENGKPYMYRLNPTTHETIRSDDFNKYWGYSGTSEVVMQNLFPSIGYVDAACYQSLGGGMFTTYELSDVKTVGLRSLLPFIEWRTADLTLKVDNDNNLTIILSANVNVAISEMNYVNTLCTTTITFKDMNNSTIPSYFVEA